MIGASVIVTTARPNPRFDLLAVSLERALQRTRRLEPGFEIELIIVDALAWDVVPGRRPADYAEAFPRAKRSFELRVGPPKPSPWQGPSRRTKRDFWAKCNASNTGIEIARGRRLIFLDDCMYVDDAWLTAHVSAHPQTAVAGTVNSVTEAVLDEHGVLANFTIDPGDKQDSMRDHGVGVYRTSGNFLWGMNCSVPANVARQVGGYDEAYDGQRAFEDVDFGIRVERTGTPVYFDPGCLVYQVLDTHTAAPADSSSSEIVSNRELLKALSVDSTRVRPLHENYDRLKNGCWDHIWDWRTKKRLQDLG